MVRERPMRAALLALLYGVSGAFSLINAAWPIRADSPVVLGLFIGVVGVVLAGVIWWRSARLSDAEVHAALLLAAVLVALLASQSMTRVGVVALGPIVITLCLYAGWFLPLITARLHAAAIIALASTGAALARPDRFLVFWLVAVVTAAFLTEIQGRLAEQLRRAATTDPLTGLANRRAWEAEATRVLAHTRRTGEPVTVALLDLDHFKEVNDQSGHEAGDELLRDLTARWSGELRQSDLLGRYGGDEFVLCLPGTDAAGTAEILARLDASHPFRWSVGTATAVEGDTLSTMLSRADAALYEHKRRSRAG
ncbi:GGDEF domain-containing protein [Blastococcus jejuensis]